MPPLTHANLTTSLGYYAFVANNGKPIRDKRKLYTAEDGTVKDSPAWDAGLIFPASPFTTVTHLITKGFTTFDVPVKGCKTKDNVTVTIDCSIVFRIMGNIDQGEDPDLVRIFKDEVTPHGLEQQLKDAMAQEIRILARSLPHTAVYACRTPGKEDEVFVQADSANYDEESIGKEGAAGQAADDLVKTAVVEVRDMTPAEEALALGVSVTKQMEINLNRQFQKQGVEISDVMIQNIKLPAEISSQMSNATMVKSKRVFEMMEQQYQMNEIEIKNKIAKLSLKHEEALSTSQVKAEKAIQAVKDNFEERKTLRNKE